MDFLQSQPKVREGILQKEKQFKQYAIGTDTTFDEDREQLQQKIRGEVK